MNDINIIEQKELPGSQKQLVISVEKALLDKVKKETFDAYAKEVNYPGFRKGKVPQKIIEENFSDVINERVLNNVLQKATLEALDQTKLYPINTPNISITKYVPQETLEYTVEFAVYPNVKIGDIKSIKVKEQELTEEDQQLPEEQKHQKEHEYKDQYFNSLIEEAIKLMEVEIPHVMIEDELNSRENTYINRLKQLNISLEDYLKSRGISLEDQRKEWEKEAEFIIKQQLFLTQLARDEKIDVSEEEVEQEINKLDTSLQETYRAGSNRMYIIQLMKNQKAFNKLIEITGGTNESHTHSH